MAFGEMLIFLIVGFVVVLAITAKQNRRNIQFFERRSCRRCAAIYPVNAKFCGRCGNKL